MSLLLLGQLRAQDSPRLTDPKAQHWEYKVIEVDWERSNYDQLMSGATFAPLGDAGWELVTCSSEMTRSTGSGTTHSIDNLIFKRPRP